MLAQATSEAVVNKVDQRCLRILYQCAKGGLRRCDQFAEVECEFALHQHANHPQRMPTQRERVFIACRQIADAEHADQRFQLISKSNDNTDLIAR